MSTRTIRTIAAAQPTSDGAGVRLYRALGTSALPAVDPFLMLDEFRSDQAGDYIAGFPMHPHRGFETVTIMLAGAMRHRDSVGNTGHLRGGSVQWMTAGRGIIHEEMPEQEDGLMWGYQLWVNLPAKSKMVPARYQDIAADQIPSVEADGCKVRVIAGTFRGTSGPVEAIVTEPLLFEIEMDPNAALDLPIAEGKSAFFYVALGTVQVADRFVNSRQIAALSDGEGLSLRAGADGARLLVCAANPIREPIARYGPFVMNTEAELHQAFADYRSGRFGT
jgi:redox-sensitive bicupin YhaK (pirin superfamily)